MCPAFLCFVVYSFVFFVIKCLLNFIEEKIVHHQTLRELHSGNQEETEKKMNRHPRPAWFVLQYVMSMPRSKDGQINKDNDVVAQMNRIP